MTPRVTVVGLGLLGGSLLQALSEKGFRAALQGVSAPETVAAAKKAGLIERGWGYDEVDLWKAGSDLVVLATPIDRIEELLRALAASPARFPEGAVVTDVGSTKRRVCELGRSLSFGAPEPLFVGSERKMV